MSDYRNRNNSELDEEGERLRQTWGELAGGARQTRSAMEGISMALMEPVVRGEARLSRELPVDALKLHPVVQRFRHEEKLRQREAHIQWLVENWDDNKVGRLLVVKAPDGGYFILIGGHRHAAARKLHKVTLPCEELVGVDEGDLRRLVELTLADERRRSWTPFNEFTLNVTVGIEPDASIEGILNENGARSGLGSLRSYSCVDKLRKVYADGTLFSTVFVIEGAWGKWDSQSGPNAENERRAARSALMVQGLGLLFLRYGANIDEAAFIERLSRREPSTILGAARIRSRAVRGGLMRHLCDDLVSVYNQRRRGKELAPFKMPRRRG